MFFFTVNCFVLDVARGGGKVPTDCSCNSKCHNKISNSFFGSFVFRIFLRTDDGLRILLVVLNRFKELCQHRSVSRFALLSRFSSFPFSPPHAARRTFFIDFLLRTFFFRHGREQAVAHGMTSSIFDVSDKIL